MASSYEPVKPEEIKTTCEVENTSEVEMEPWEQPKKTTYKQRKELCKSIPQRRRRRLVKRSTEISRERGEYSKTELPKRAISGTIYTVVVTVANIQRAMLSRHFAKIEHSFGETGLSPDDVNILMDGIRRAPLNRQWTSLCANFEPYVYMVLWQIRRGASDIIVRDIP